MAKPLHIQRLEKALELGPFMKYAENLLLQQNDEEIENSSDDDGVKRHTYQDKMLMFNSENIGEDRKWLFNLLLSETESSETEASETDDYVAEMLKEHVREKRYRQKYHQNSTVSACQITAAEILIFYSYRTRNTATILRVYYRLLTCIQNSNSW